VDQDDRIPHRVIYNSTLMVINIDFDFVQKVNDIKYITLVDVMAKLGGFRASLAPIL